MFSLLMVLLAAADPTDSVVRIQVSISAYDYNLPWQKQTSQEASGSGFVVKGQRILTNAHVVSDTLQILVKRRDRPNPVPATIEFIGHDVDLALLKVEDPTFLKGMQPLELEEALPKLQSKVVTLGYPMGGREVSATVGVVSRVEVNTYAHTRTDSHLTVQTDAAINPGNSGGPVVSGNKFLGVAFQGLSGGQSLGYFIPAPMVKHFFDDIKDGKYDGVPFINASWIPLYNPSYRKFLKVPESVQGVVIQDVPPGGSDDGVLKPDDVLTSIDGYAVANDGRVKYQGHLVDFSHVSELKQVGEPIRFTVFRNGQKKDVVGISKEDPWNAKYGRPHFEEAPRYLIHDGLLFMSLTHLTFLSLLEAAGSEQRIVLDWEHYFRRREKPDSALDEPIVLTRVFKDETNAGLPLAPPMMLKTIDGLKVKSLEELDQQLNKPDMAFHRLVFAPGDLTVILDAAVARSTHRHILETYEIPNDKNF